jgi:hypothetical protein
MCGKSEKRVSAKAENNEMGVGIFLLPFISAGNNYYQVSP